MSLESGGRNPAFPVFAKNASEYFLDYPAPFWTPVSSAFSFVAGGKPLFGISGCVSGLFSRRWGGGRKAHNGPKFVFFVVSTRKPQEPNLEPSISPRAKHVAVPCPSPKEPEICKKNLIMIFGVFSK